MEQQSNTPANVPITPRNRKHDLAASLAGDWYDKHPFKTAWYNSMSITFPLGEEFFIESVRAFADQVVDPKLQAEVRQFCGQEGFHRREHDRYNRTLCQLRNYDLGYLEKRLEKNIELSRKMYSPLQQLAMTAALEHITAILAESALDLENPESAHMGMRSSSVMQNARLKEGDRSACPTRYTTPTVPSGPNSQARWHAPTAARDFLTARSSSTSPAARARASAPFS